MATKIAIDSDVTFELKNQRTVTVDAYELSQFKDGLWREATEDKDGTKRLPWETIITRIRDWVKASNPTIDLSASEALGIWHAADRAWSEKKRGWAPAETSPTSPRFLDPASFD